MNLNPKDAINKILEVLYQQLEGKKFTEKEINSITIQFKYKIERPEKISRGNTTQLIDEPIGDEKEDEPDSLCLRCDKHGCHNC
ncbi:MAG TPA: hypothetical protein VK772_16295 [Puia sp.]|jgi:hypothetical protein|nr:hypothetical protein [Puia sp.]